MVPVYCSSDGEVCVLIGATAWNLTTSVVGSHVVLNWVGYVEVFGRTSLFSFWNVRNLLVGMAGTSLSTTLRKSTRRGCWRPSCTVGRFPESAEEFLDAARGTGFSFRSL